MKGREKGIKDYLTGYFAFFLTVAAIAASSAAVFFAVKEKTGSIGIGCAVTISLAVLLALVCYLVDTLRRKITVDKPVETILDATSKIATGDFSVRTSPLHPYGKYDEYDAIMENINCMAAELSKNEMLKNDFISNVSHEIKTPLSVIKSCASAIGSGLSEEKTREYIVSILSAADRLNDLVGNILKLNKLENQKIFPEKKKFDLAAQVAECVLRFEDKAEEKNITIDCDLDEEKVVSDPDLLEIIWNNLLSNAIKFTQRGGNIWVKLKDEGENVCVSVRDDGCGMNADTGARIFEKFYQGDTSHAAQGNGLGLALVKRVIDILGGEIAVESIPDRGSTFTVRLQKGRKEREEKA